MAAIDLLLVGRTGNGKSSTGNSILKRKVFIPRSFGASGSENIDMNSALIEGRNVTVVDGLGLGDTETRVTENVKTAIELSEKALSRFYNGFNALIICLKYGIRFTQQEKDTVQMVRSIFGNDVIKKHGIIVMTHGDNFDQDSEDEGRTFEAWCKDQTGDIQDLFRECGNRYVLFNNRTKDNERLDKQTKILMSKVAEIHGKYTKDDFLKAEFGRRKLIVQSKLPQLEKRTTEFVDRITQQVRKVDDTYYTPRDKMLELDRIKHDIIIFKEQLHHDDDGSKSISQLLLQISIIESTIRTKTERVQLEKNRQQLNIPPQELNPPPAGNFIQKKEMAIGSFVIFAILYFVYNYIKDIFAGGRKEV